jgi:hypothetical protein
MPEPPPLPPPGLSRPTTTPVPDEIFDLWLPHLSEAELKVLLYICRRTFGFKKDADAIALSQLVKGIVTREGKRLDWGAGVSENSVLRAVKGLEAKGLIYKEAHSSPERGHETTVYGLLWRDSPSPQNSGSLPPKLAVTLPPAQQVQETVESTNRETGLDPNLLAAIRTLCYQRRWPLPEARALALAAQAGTLARWQAASAGARSLAEVAAALEQQAMLEAEVARLERLQP